MRFINQREDTDDYLEADSQVRAIRETEHEEGEIVETRSPNSDVLDLHSTENWDDYGILAVGRKKGTARFTVDLTFANTKLTFMIDTGSPVSFIDITTANSLVAAECAELRDLTTDEHGEKFADFNGNTVRRQKVMTATVKCADWVIITTSVDSWGRT